MLTFSQYHCNTMSPLSYDEVARHVLVNIPAHQITFRRYDKFSEADEP